MPPWDALTFDCYGTLIDWEDGIASAFVREAEADGVSLDRCAGSSARTTRSSRRVEAERYESYRDVLDRTARRVADRLGWELSEERSRFLPSRCRTGVRFPTRTPRSSISRQRGIAWASCRTWTTTFSKGRGPTFPWTRDHRHGGAGALLQAGAGTLPRGRRRIGPARWLHAAQSWFHDVVPAHELGIPVAWVNRKSERPAAPPGVEAEFPTLLAFAEWLTRA